MTVLPSPTTHSCISSRFFDTPSSWTWHCITRHLHLWSRMREAWSTAKRALTLKEIGLAFAIFRQHMNSFGFDNYLALCLYLALGIRKGELTGAKWREFDLEKAVWMIPEDRTKTTSPSPYHYLAKRFDGCRSSRFTALGPSAFCLHVETGIAPISVAIPSTEQLTRCSASSKAARSPTPV